MPHFTDDLAQALDKGPKDERCLACGHLPTHGRERREDPRFGPMSTMDQYAVEIIERCLGERIYMHKNDRVLQTVYPVSGDQVQLTILRWLKGPA